MGKQTFSARSGVSHRVVASDQPSISDGSESEWLLPHERLLSST